jgi:RNA polymerase sigma-70 factor (ECF subfamily)
VSDHDLVRRMLDGDEHAFETFFETYFDRVFRFAARSVSDGAAAEDIAQAALVTAIRKLHTWRADAALFTWLCAICRREIVAHYTRTAPSRLAARVAVLDRLASPGLDPEAEAQRAETSRRVQIALDDLPDRYGDVLEWKYLQGLSVNEIAGRLGLTAKAAESMLTRARAAFRQGFNSLSGSWEAS